MANCERCGKYLSMCVCADLPEKEECSYYYLFNRWAENWTRWLRALGFLVVLVLALPAHSTWKPEYANNHPNVSKWFKSANLTLEAAIRLGWTSCCEKADRYMTKVTKDGLGWQYYTDPQCTWNGCKLAPIPQDTIHQDSLPDGAEFEQMRAEGVLFIYNGKVTRFWPPESGG